ncbi:MAG TPA: hypothetical protein VKU41_16200, partial [Polyangiaceae bacterium]|nr:hypothetical protein [Polyangiaceae bacterium]
SLRLPVGADVLKPLQKLLSHPDFERARFVIEMLGRMPGAEAARGLVGVLADTKDKRRAELAAASLAEARAEGTTAAPGSSPIRDEAVPALAKALLEASDTDRAWLLRAVVRPSAKKIPAAARRELLETACRRLSSGQTPWEPLLAAARDADAQAAAQALRDVAVRLRKAQPDKAAVVLRVLCHGEGGTDDDRYTLAAVELARGTRDTRAAARAGDESLRMFGALLGRGVDVATHLKKDRSLDLSHLYYVGFHFAEQGDPVGEELLKTVVEKGGRAKIAKMARSKLALVDA